MQLHDFCPYGIDRNLKIDFQFISIRGVNPVGRKLINLKLSTLNCPLRPLFIVKTDTIMKNKGMSYNSFDDKGKLNGCHYYIQDYQGNNCMVVNSSRGTVRQVNHFYTYGGLIGNISTTDKLQNYKFGGKELDRTYGLDWYDFVARQYDPAVPMFNRPDDHAESYYGISPYAYCAGDPINLIDPTGEDIYYYDEYGNLVDIEKNEKYDQVVVQNGNEKSQSAFGAKYAYGTIRASEGSILQINDNAIGTQGRRIL